MKKILPILVMFSFLSTSVLAQETYTISQYESMLPELSKIDFKKIPYLPINITLADLKHRTWYSLTENNPEISKYIQNYNNSYAVLLYVWKGKDSYFAGIKRNIMIMVMYNDTKAQGVLVVDFTNGETGNFFMDYIPKEVADYSLKDLPLKGKNYTPYMLMGIGFIGILGIMAYAFRHEELIK